MHYPDVVKETLDRIVAMVGDLPAAPAVVNAAMGMTADLETKISDLSRVLALDQSLTAKVLRLSNSPYYGRRQAVQTLPEGVYVVMNGQVFDPHKARKNLKMDRFETTEKRQLTPQ